jgi:tRNA pseudouridine55 synthase
MMGGILPAMTPGIHLLHKPIGPTSFSLVQSCLNQRVARPGHRPPRICHGGTLDPFASGLLLILVEPATRLFDHLHAIPKTYDATVRWGTETDNGDLHGNITFTGDSSTLTPQQLDDALPTFIGWHDQIPHPTSAKRIDGERAYLKAHRGETVIMPPSRVYLHEAHWLSHDLPRESRLQMTVRGGYYVRAMARDLGRLVGCGAHLTALHRSTIGPWNDPGPGNTTEVHARDLLPWAPLRILTDSEVGELRQDRTIPIGELLPPDWPLPPDFPEPNAPIRGFHLDHFCFLLKPHEGQLRALSALRGGL